VRYRRDLKNALKDPHTNKVRFDVQGRVFATIRYAFTHLPTQQAHRRVLSRIKKLTTSNISLLYLDSKPALEKEQTHNERDKVRTKARETARG
jgi:hypothetical protein